MSLACVSMLCTGDPNKSELDQLAIKYGTDKSSKWHNYAPTYDKYFNSVRNFPLKFLEIGLAGGCSAHMWEQYFTNADLHFIDNTSDFVKNYQSTAPDRSHCYLVDQANEESLIQFIQQSGGDFDIILDDGGHKMDQQITSFRVLFPILKSGGVYIIEDLGTSYLLEWGGYGTKPNPKTGPGTTISFLQQLIDEINSFTVKPCQLPWFCADFRKYNQNDLTYYQQHIESIHCYNCMVIIFKR